MLPFIREKGENKCVYLCMYTIYRNDTRTDNISCFRVMGDFSLNILLYTLTV